MRAKLAILLVVVCSLLGLTMPQAGAAYVMSNHNWWVQGRSSVWHIAGDHWSDGSWHIVAYHHYPGHPGYQKLNMWIEDWACPYVYAGVQGSMFAKLELVTNKQQHNPGGNYCDVVSVSVRPNPWPVNYNEFHHSGNGWNWYSWGTPIAYNTGLIQDYWGWIYRQTPNRFLLD